MTNNLLTLFCLVEGESTPFPVKIESSESIGELKKAIKTEIPDTLNGIDAKDLTLWRVEVPLAPLQDRKPIVLNEVDSATELDPTDDLADVFEVQPPKKRIHVIVQRPPP
ncbi:hypothetical protein BGZ58_006036, partial [Dissophora ornata]